jgi:hypothetical protein
MKYTMPRKGGGGLDSNVAMVPESGCWLWLGKWSVRGYGRVSLKGRPGRHKSAHRTSWEESNGPIPQGMCVLHKCDVRACINPAHLFLGTQAENMEDMARKGRRRHPGLEVGRLSSTGGRPKKLTPAQVHEIKMLQGVMSRNAIARKFGVSGTMIGFILRGMSWKGLD